MLRRERKQRIEAAEAYRAAGRPDRAEAEEAEIAGDRRVPARRVSSDAELEAIVDAAIAETGAASMKDMGKVMGRCTQRSAAAPTAARPRRSCSAGSAG